jgi:hypothetical protein
MLYGWLVRPPDVKPDVRESPRASTRRLMVGCISAAALLRSAAAIAAAVAAARLGVGSDDEARLADLETSVSAAVSAVVLLLALRSDCCVLLSVTFSETGPEPRGGA